MKILHCVESHPTNDPRIARARESWRRLYVRHELFPCPLDKYQFSSALLGDPRNLPSLREIIGQGYGQASAEDIVLLTNGDTILHPELPSMLKQTLAHQWAVCSFRLNGMLGLEVLRQSPDELSLKLNRDYGRDMFAFTKGWLDANMGKIPELFAGEFEWDLILALLIRLSIGIEIGDHRDLSQMTKAELPLGYVLHERHAPAWLQPDSFGKNPANLWNRSLARQWYEDNNLRQFYTLG